MTPACPTTMTTTAFSTDRGLSIKTLSKDMHLSLRPRGSMVTLLAVVVALLATTMGSVNGFVLLPAGSATIHRRSFRVQPSIDRINQGVPVSPVCLYETSSRGSRPSSLFKKFLTRSSVLSGCWWASQAYLNAYTRLVFRGLAAASLATLFILNLLSSNYAMSGLFRKKESTAVLVLPRVTTAKPQIMSKKKAVAPKWQESKKNIVAKKHYKHQGNAKKHDTFQLQIEEEQPPKKQVMCAWIAHRLYGEEERREKKEREELRKAHAKQWVETTLKATRMATQHAQERRMAEEKRRQEIMNRQELWIKNAVDGKS